MTTADPYQRSDVKKRENDAAVAAAAAAAAAATAHTLHLPTAPHELTLFSRHSRDADDILYGIFGSNSMAYLPWSSSK